MVLPNMLHAVSAGLTLFHCALASSENLNMVKFFLSQEAALPMLLSSFKQEGSQPALPLDLAKKLVVSYQTAAVCCRVRTFAAELGH